MSVMASTEFIRVCSHSNHLSAPLAQTALSLFFSGGDGLNTDLCMTFLRWNDRGNEEMIRWFSALTFRQTAGLMSLVTLFAPIAVFSGVSGGGFVGNQVYYVNYVIIAPLWTFGFGGIYNPYYSGLVVLDPLRMIGLLPATFFGFVFGVLVVRYCQDKCSRRRVYFGAIASVVFPLFLLAMTIPTSIALHILAFNGPVPIQLTIGLLLVSSHRVPGSDSPWFDEEKEAV
jgi:hypothetical protein